MLDRELGVPPLEETNAVYEAIKENQTPPPPTALEPGLSIDKAPGERSSSRPHPIPTTSGFPLVGRSAEWDAMLQAYGSVTEHGHLLVLEGEAGIGKTRLAESLLEHVRSTGSRTLRARCYEGESGLAYGPFIECLRSALDQQGPAEWTVRVPAHRLSEVSRLVPELKASYPDLPPVQPVDGPGAQSQFFEALSQVLGAATGRGGGGGGGALCSWTTSTGPTRPPLIW